jgi:hypothetical protein
MRLKVLPYVTVEVDDRVRLQLRSTAERLRLNVRAYLLSAADDVDTAGDKVRDVCDAAVHRVDDAVGRVTDRLGQLTTPLRCRRRFASTFRRMECHQRW